VLALRILGSVLPIAWLLLALSVFRLKAWKAALSALLVAIAVALVLFGAELPAFDIPSSVLNGCSLALYPICLVILSALFTYAVTVESGAMEVIRSGLAELSGDQRVLALLIVWGFGNFIEGMAGFGTAVAIPASILVEIGFDPFKAVVMCLVANTTPTAFGSVGVPLMTLAKVSGSDMTLLTWYAAWMQLLVTAAGPFLVLLVLDGWNGIRGIWKLLLTLDVAFLVPWVLAARYLGLELPDILGGLSVMAVIVLRAVKTGVKVDFRAQFRAWLPFAFVIVILTIAAFLPASVKAYASPGVLILVAALLGGLCQGLAFMRLLRLLLATLCRYWAAFVTIGAVLSMSRVMSDAGMIAILAESLVRLTGSAYPFFAPVVGALGGFVTGSGTSANVLFGALQADAAVKIGEIPELLAAANVMGAGIGKMICPQSIAIGAAATALVGRESEIFRHAIVWFPMVLLVACVITAVVAFVI